jgi:hypothetical protein
MREFKTDFEFKNERSYVHSTTMIEEVSRLVFNEICSSITWNLPKIDAKFHRIIESNGTFIITDNTSLFTHCIEPSAEFKIYDINNSMNAFFIEDNKMIVVRKVRTEYSVENINFEGNFSGTCTINCSSRQVMTENIIEANKRFHQLSLEDKGSLKIVNLYLRRLPLDLPRSVALSRSHLILKIQNIGARERDNSIATLNSLYFPELKSDRFELSYVTNWNND